MNSYNQSYQNWEKKADKIIVEASTKNGAKVSIFSDNLQHSIFRLNGTGFQPHENVNFISNSNGEVLHYSLTADEKVNLMPITIQPAVIAKTREGFVILISCVKRNQSI